MPTATMDQLEPTYHQQWDQAKILPARDAEAQVIASRIFANKARYEVLAKQTGVPYWWIGAVHNRESSLSFKGHLHNGDSLNARTHNEPGGRPAEGEPPYDWEYSAIDALKMAPHKLHLIKRWSRERACFEWERYNGMGYLKKGPSPYVWSGTTVYKHGKYVRDGEYVDEVVDKQLGCVIVAQELALIDPDVARALKDSEEGPPPDVLDRETKDAKDGRNAGAIITGGGAIGTATGVAQDAPMISPMVTFAAIGIGLAMVILFTVLASRKLALVKSKWG